MEIKEQLYEGKAKKVFATEDPEVVLVDYKDDATAGNGAKKGTIRGKGVVNNRVTNHLMKMLMEKGIPTHLVEELDDRRTLVKRVEIVPLEVIVRNVAAGSLAKRLGLAEGTKLRSTVLEYCYKDDALGDPMVNEYHIAAIGAATPEELRTIADYSFRVNQYLGEYLAEEISPDTCRFWDVKTGAHLDKDLFRRDLGGEEAAYQEVMKRLLGE